MAQAARLPSLVMPSRAAVCGRRWFRDPASRTLGRGRPPSCRLLATVRGSRSWSPLAPGPALPGPRRAPARRPGDRQPHRPGLRRLRQHLLRRAGEAGALLLGVRRWVDRAVGRHPRAGAARWTAGSPRPGGGQQTQHPLLYYVSMGVVHLHHDHDPRRADWSFDRLVSCSASTWPWWPPPGHRLPDRPADRDLDRASVFAGLLVMAIPQLAHIGSSVNNDNLVVLFGALAALGPPR